MSKIVEGLKLLHQPLTYISFAAKLNLSKFEVLELIGKINQIEPNLINTSFSPNLMLNRKLDWLSDLAVNHFLLKLNQTQYTIKILDQTDSTNSYLATNLPALVSKTVISTEFQAKGRGRLGRLWVSKIATDLAASFLYFFPLDFAFELLPLISAIAINRLFKHFGHITKIKWPNDVLLIDSTKASGILVESGIYNKKRFVIIGIGINNGLNIARNELLAYLINYLDQVINEYCSYGFNLLQQEWIDNCIHYNKMVHIYQGSDLINSGINSDLTVNGQLAVTSAGQTNYYSGSNISLRW